MGRKLILFVLAAVLILQFFRGTPPEVRDENPADLMASVEVENAMATLLKNACYDCHSLETKYPWYSYVTPVSWRLFEHVEHGREELNFSEWGNMEKSRKLKKLKEISEEVLKGAMPLESYSTMHGEADLTEEQRQNIADWAEALALKTMQEE